MISRAFLTAVALLACTACATTARLPKGTHATGLVPDAARVKSRAANERTYGTLPATVEVVRGITYKEQFPHECQLDVFRPKAEGSLRPVIVKLHGGGLEGGDRSWHPQVIHALAEEGFVVVTVNYRKYPEYRWPAMLQDAGAALRWVGEHAAEHGGDATRVGVLGDSAGAYLAASLATMDRKVFGGKTTVRPKAAVLWYGAYSFVPREGLELTGWGSAADWKVMPAPRDEAPGLWKLASPIEHLSPDDASLLLIHGDSDRIVPVGQSLVFAEEAKKRAVDAELLVVANADHGFRRVEGKPAPELSFEEITARTISYFARTLKRPDELASSEGLPRTDVASEESREKSSGLKRIFGRNTAGNAP